MAKDNGETVWKAVRARLLADSDIQTVMGSGYANRIARRALPGDALPCILCPSIEADDRSTDNTDADSVRLEIHIWGDEKSTVTVSGDTVTKAIRLAGLVANSLHRAQIGVLCTVERVLGPLADPVPSLQHLVVVASVISDHSDA